MERESKTGNENEKTNTWNRTEEAGSSEWEKTGKDDGSTKAMYENAIRISLIYVNKIK